MVGQSSHKARDQTMEQSQHQDFDDAVEDVMKKFKESGAWNLPVVENEKYVGFISKSKLLTAYRNKLIEVTA